MAEACISGTGQLLPPYIVYSGKYLLSNCTNGGPVGTRYAVTTNGWMDTSTFIDWFKNLYIPALIMEKPVLLILDGHSSHVSYEVQELAIKKPDNNTISHDAYTTAA